MKDCGSLAGGLYFPHWALDTCPVGQSIQTLWVIKKKERGEGSSVVAPCHERYLPADTGGVAHRDDDCAIVPHHFTLLCR